MTRTYTITPDFIITDIDLLDPFLYTSEEVFYLELFEDGFKVCGCDFYTEEDATSEGERFIMTGELI